VWEAELTKPCRPYKTVVRPVLEYACPVQRGAMMIIFAHSNYEISLMLAGLDTLKAQRAQLTERFFRCSVLR